VRVKVIRVRLRVRMFVIECHGSALTLSLSQTVLSMTQHSSGARTCGGPQS
jgi:hypothetical protein